MTPFAIPLLTGLIDIGKELIEDKDKRNEFAIRSQELTHETMRIMLQTETSPWIDGAVKILYALQTFWRPAVSAGVLVWGLLNPDAIGVLHQLGTVGDGVIASVFGSFPAWGISRHKEKMKKAETYEAYPGSD